MSPGVAPPTAGSGQGPEPAEVMSGLPEGSGPGSLQTDISPVLSLLGDTLTA